MVIEKKKGNDRIILITDSNTPTATDGEKGEIRWDDNYLYLATDDLIWKNIQFSTLGLNLDHGTLVGLADDDHTQYWISGSARTGNFSTSGTLGAGAITGTSFII